MSQNRIRISKAALSLSTAFLMVSSIVSMTTTAAATNEFVLTADRSSAAPGDTVNVMLAYSPDADGVAGFTMLLHYDPEKCSVYIPTDEELETEFDIDSRFAVITNYDYSYDTVRIVGADMTGSNVKKDTPITMAQFTVLDGAEGSSLDYWLEVEALYTSVGDVYESASYTAPSHKNPFKVTVPAATTTSITTTKAETTTTTTKATTTTTTTTTEAETTTTTELITEAPVTTTVPETSFEETETTLPETEEITETTVPEEEPAPAEEPAEDNEEAGDALFTYEQGAKDFQSEETVQYGFRISDYIDDYSTNYDVIVNIDTTGNVSGAIGTMIDGQWTSEANSSNGATEDQWVFEDLDPNSSSDLIFMQIYYMKANSRVNISSVEFVPVNGSGETIDETPAEPEAQPEDIVCDSEESCESESYTEETEENTEEEYPAAEPEEPYYEDNTAAEAEDNETAEAPETGADSDTAPEAGETSDDESAAAPEKAAESADDNSSAAEPAESSETEKPSKEEVESTVDKATESVTTAPKANENPNTGSRSAGRALMDILTALCAGYVLFALVAFVYNRTRTER